MEFKDWFFKQFPEYHQNSDVNKNSQGEGTFQRYLQGFGLELDNEIMPYIHNFMDIVDIEKCDDKFLPLIATLLGNPPSFGPEADLYRKVLSYALAIYKVKGTKLSYKIFLGILGLTISIIEEEPARKTIYDEVPPAKYDTGKKYDSACANCSNYWITYNLGNEPVDPELLVKAQKVICFLQPIHARFQGWVYSITINDTYTDPLGDEFNLQLL